MDIPWSWKHICYNPNFTYRSLFYFSDKNIDYIFLFNQIIDFDNDCLKSNFRMSEIKHNRFMLSWGELNLGRLASVSEMKHNLIECGYFD